MTSRQAKIQEDTYYRVMRLLQEQPDMSQRDLADKVGISLGALNYCLKALMDKGFVKLENFQNSKHKFKYAYILTPKRIEKENASFHPKVQLLKDEGSWSSMDRRVASLLAMTAS